jgi:hypothetical protein
MNIQPYKSAEGANKNSLSTFFIFKENIKINFVWMTLKKAL